MEGYISSAGFRYCRGLRISVVVFITIKFSCKHIFG